MRALVLVLATGCLKDVAYTCSTNADCEHHSQPGFCEADKHCAYLDPSCMSGFRYGALAGGESNQCVTGLTDGGLGGDTSGACPGSYSALPGVPTHLYFTLLTATNWTTQRDRCAANGQNVYLAIPDDQTELNAIVSAAGSLTTWVGISDTATPGTYLTVKGTAPTFLPWDNGQPNNNNGKDCVRVAPSTMLLSDDTCTNLYKAVCECEP